MRLLVSSKILFESIQKSFDRNCTTIQYDYELCSLAFTCDNGTFYMPAKDHENHFDCVKFKPLPMANLMLFLKTITEQPILLILENDAIEVHQPIIKFM